VDAEIVPIQFFAIFSMSIFRYNFLPKLTHIIRNAQGVAFVNFADYKFIEGKAPTTVNPALWHQAKLNGLSGLYKVAAGIYEARSFDVANIIFIETKNGYIVVDPLTNIDAAKSGIRFGKKTMLAINQLLR
jgi:alkyl sulfatase BDS1-like metallo-beta-lactamase superfamily hydrolase